MENVRQDQAVEHLFSAPRDLSPRVLAALRYVGGGRISGVAEYRLPTEAERAWIARAQNDPRNLPQPAVETLSAWTNRATQRYRALEAIIYPAGRARRPPTRRDERSLNVRLLDRYAEWLMAKAREQMETAS